MALINNDAAPSAQAPEKAAPKKNLKSSVIVVLNGEYPLAEPFTHQRFEPGIPTETPEITPWIQAQLDVGLFSEVQ